MFTYHYGTYVCVIRAVSDLLQDGLRHVHSVGIMHRDIKRRNVIFHRDTQTESGYGLKIIDFHLSEFVEYGPDLRDCSKVIQRYGADLEEAA